MTGDISLFGYQSDSPAARAAYDMMVMQDMGVLDAPEEKPEEYLGESGSDPREFCFAGTFNPRRGW